MAKQGSELGTVIGPQAQEEENEARFVNTEHCLYYSKWKAETAGKKKFIVASPSSILGTVSGFSYSCENGRAEHLDSSRL